MVCIIPVGILQLVQSMLAQSVDNQGQHKGADNNAQQEIKKSGRKCVHVSFVFDFNKGNANPLPEKAQSDSLGFQMTIRTFRLKKRAFSTIRTDRGGKNGPHGQTRRTPSREFQSRTAYTVLGIHPGIHPEEIRLRK